MRLTSRISGSLPEGWRKGCDVNHNSGRGRGFTTRTHPDQRSAAQSGVLVTPVVLALAAQLGLDRMLFAYTAIWLANTASLLLPVSNLTNLLSVRVLGMAAPAFTRLIWPAAMAALLVTVAALAVTFRRSLRGRYTRVPDSQPWDRSLLAIAMIVCLALGSLFAIGVNVTYASAVAALVLVVACLLRAPQLLSLRLVPWTLLAGVSALFVGVQLAHDHGLGAVLGVAAGAAGEGFTGLLRLTGISALGANLVNNLPRLPSDGAGDKRFTPADGRIASGGQHRPTHHPMGESGNAAVGKSLSSGGHPDSMADLRPPRTDHCAGPHRHLGCGARRRSDDAAHRRTARRLDQLAPRLSAVLPQHLDSRPSSPPGFRTLVLASTSP